MKMLAAVLSMLMTVRAASVLTQDRPKASIEAELRRLNDEVSSMQVRKDVATADRLLADDYVFMQADGEVANKAATLAVLKSPDFECQLFTTEDVQVRAYGDAAVITGIAHFKATFRDQIADGDFRYTDVWVKRDGGWQTVSSHASRVPKRLQAQRVAAALVGTWKLLSWEARSASGEATWPLGTNAVGVLTYDPYGHVSVQLMRPSRPPFASGDPFRGTPEEVKDASEGFLSYFGTYSVDEAAGRITHHVEGSSFPNYVGTDLQRTFTLTGDKLTLVSVSRTIGGQTGNGILTWERVN
ncbi:MAG: lipocalin-like domain-containing protein [Vicinamibacterales bacterium]